MTDLERNRSAATEFADEHIVFGQVIAYDPGDSLETSHAPELNGPVRIYYPESTSSEVVIRLADSPQSIFSIEIRDRIRKLFK